MSYFFKICRKYHVSSKEEEEEEKAEGESGASPRTGGV